MRKRHLVITILALVLLAGPGSSSSASGATRCPPLPRTLSALIATDAGADHPLTAQFRNTLWPYPERAAACFGGSKISVSAFVASPEGLGGTAAFRIEPRWIFEQGLFLAVDDSTVDPSANKWMPVAVPPSLRPTYDAERNHWVSINGHFHDAAAKRCVVTEGEPPAAPPPDVAVAICETSFVLSSITALPQAPRTDGEPGSAAPAGGFRLDVVVGTLLVVLFTLARLWRRRLSSANGR